MSMDPDAIDRGARYVAGHVGPVLRLWHIDDDGDPVFQLTDGRVVTYREGGVWYDPATGESGDLPEDAPWVRIDPPPPPRGSGS
jgi:hypothetical protein